MIFLFMIFLSVADYLAGGATVVTVFSLADFSILGDIVEQQRTCGSVLFRVIMNEYLST